MRPIRTSRTRLRAFAEPVPAIVSRAATLRRAAPGDFGPAPFPEPRVRPSSARALSLRLLAWALFCVVLTQLAQAWAAGAALAETWEEAALRLEEESRREKMDAATRDLFYAISDVDADKVALAVALGADVNRCVAFSDATRRKCAARMLDYAVRMYDPVRDEDGGQEGLSILRLLLRRGARLVADGTGGKRDPLSLRGLFAKEGALSLFLESGYEVTPDLLAVACQYRSPTESYRSSFPLQILLKAGPYTVESVFRGRDFRPGVRRAVVRHMFGLKGLETPPEEKDVENVEGVGLLHLAAVTGNTEVASWLLRQGLAPDRPTGTGATPLDIAYALWVYTWNERVWGDDFRFDLADFLDFLRLLLLHGADPEPVRRHRYEHPEVYESIFVLNCQEFRMPDPEKKGGAAGPLALDPLSPESREQDGTSEGAGTDGTVSMREFLERHFTRTNWKLSRYDVLELKGRNLCTVVVDFEGTLKKDLSRVRIPMVFMDNVLVIAGDPAKDRRFPVWRDGERLGVSRTRAFWKMLGVDVGDDAER